MHWRARPWRCGGRWMGPHCACAAKARQSTDGNDDWLNDVATAAAVAAAAASWAIDGARSSDADNSQGDWREALPGIRNAGGPCRQEPAPKLQTPSPEPHVQTESMVSAQPHGPRLQMGRSTGTPSGTSATTATRARPPRWCGATKNRGRVFKSIFDYSDHPTTVSAVLFTT